MGVIFEHNEVRPGALDDPDWVHGEVLEIVTRVVYEEKVPRDHPGSVFVRGNLAERGELPVGLGLVECVAFVERSRQTVGQAALGFDGGQGPEFGITPRWVARITEDAPPQLVLALSVRANSDGTIVLKIDPSTFPGQLWVLTKHRRLTLEITQHSIGGMPIQTTMPIPRVPLEGLKEVADLVMRDLGDEDQMFGTGWNPRQ